MADRKPLTPERRDEILRWIETHKSESHDGRILCPYCQHEVMDAWECGPEDGETEDMECSMCEKTFEVTLNIRHEYTTESKEEFEEEPED